MRLLMNNWESTILYVIVPKARNWTMPIVASEKFMGSLVPHLQESSSTRPQSTKTTSAWNGVLSPKSLLMALLSRGRLPVVSVCRPGPKVSRAWPPR